MNDVFISIMNIHILLGALWILRGVTAIEYGGVEYKILSDTLDMNGYTKDEIDSAIAIAKKEINGSFLIVEYRLEVSHFHTKQRRKICIR